MAELESIADCPPFPKVEGKIKHCPGWLGYAVTDQGKVWSCKPHGKHGSTYVLYWRCLTPHVGKRDGCPCVGLFKNGKRSALKKVSRLVAEAFLGPQPDSYMACHNNGVPSDNRVCNLRWDTDKANTADRIRHGRDFNGEKHPNATITNNDAELIWRLKPFLSGTEIATLLHISKWTVYKILSGKVWSKITRRNHFAAM